MNSVVLEQPLDPWQWLGRYEQSLQGTPGQTGATAVFVGSMRDFNQGDAVSGLFLEHYPGMTQCCLDDIQRRAVERWDLIDSLIVHRVGQLYPGDPIVLVAVWSAHRRAAFEASRWLMEELKSNVPLWKKEQLVAGSRWVEKNTPG